MNQSLLITLLTILTFGAMAQPPGVGGGRPGATGPSITGRISGAVIDTNTQAPIEFATVVLVDARTKQQKDGAMTDVKGEFKFPEARIGKYELHLSFLGYQNKIITDIELTPEKPDYNVDRIFLLSEGVTLDAVEVTGQSAAIENRVDKMVYNADKDISTAGSDATEVLKRVPLLTVDVEGNVQLRGSSNIQVLINGKPSTLFSGSIADALRTIPADQIKSVEVITAPTARFDGEGSAGIINIITKKKNAEGFTGSFSGSVGTRQNRGNLNLNFVRGRFGVNFGGSGWFNPGRESTSSFYRVDTQNGAERVLDQQGAGESSFYGPRVSAGAFYDINAFNSISSSFNFRGFGRSSDQLTNALYSDPGADVEQIYQRISDSRSFSNGFDWTTDYRRTFKKPEQELSFGFQLSGDLSLTESDFNQIDRSVKEQYSFLNLENRNENDGKNFEYTLQTDYVHPFSKALKLETGVKAILRRIDSDFLYQSIGDNVPTRDSSDAFFYDQDVFAGYASLSLNLGKNYALITGVRYEHTTIGGEYDINPLNFSFDYDNVLPSIIVSRKIGKMSNLRLSFSQRLQRPSLRFINPFVDLNDPREVTVGNPYLQPEITNQYELNFGTFIKGIVLNGSVYYRRTNDVIESILQVRDSLVTGVSYTSFQNIGNNESYGFNFFTSATIRKILTLRAGGNFFNYSTQGVIDGQTLSRDAFVWNANLNASLNLPKNLTVELFGFYNSPRQSLQGSRASYSQFSAGINKQFLNKRASLGLSIVQPFAKFLAFPSKLEGTNFIQESEFAVAVRSYNLNFSYRFGKLDFRNQRERRGRISNDDLKQGGDNNF